MTLPELFLVFFYIGLFAIGGGLLAASFMQQALVNQYQLISAEKFYAMLAISESTPGPIGINIATYIGTELFGVPGGIVATAGEVLPSIIVIILIAKFFSRINERPLVKSVFSALRPATSGMVMSVFFQVFSMSVIHLGAFMQSRDIKALFDWKASIVYAVSLAVLFRTRLHPVVIVAFGAAFGVLLM